MAESTQPEDSGAGGGFRLFFWKKKKSNEIGDKSKLPSDAKRTGCGGLFRRKARSKAKEPLQQEPEQPQQQPPASQTVQITFDDVELPEIPCHNSDGGSSVGEQPICDEVVCVKVKEVESAWVRPPVSSTKEAKPAPQRLALAKRASGQSGQAASANQSKADGMSADAEAAIEASIAAAAKDAEAEAERQRIAEARFQRKSVDMRNVKAKGGVKIEQTPQSEMWWNIVNKSLVGTGLFSRAVVCSLAAGGVFACNPSDFAPTAEQVALLRDNFHNPDAFSAAGFAVGGILYKVEPEACTRDLLSGVNLDHTEGLLIVKSRTALVAAGYTGGRDQARETLGDLRDLFVQQGL